MDKEYTDLVENIIKKGKCHDNFVGKIKYSNDDTVVSELYFSREKRRGFKLKNNMESNNFSNTKNIIIILESPHKDEYNSRYYENLPLPAIGRTGTNLQNNFLEIFKHKLNVYNDEEYKIILMNSIQYQCSNGESMTKDNRERTNEIWKKMWFRSGKESFLDRLKSYNPSIIINACTGNVEEEQDIKNILQKIIENNYNRRDEVSSKGS